MTDQGYYRFPTVHRDTLVFTCEDDLWCVASAGGVARRLTANVGECQRSAISPDGRWIAFTGREEGNPEVYLMPAEGGKARRLTYQGAAFGAHVVGWARDGSRVIFAANAGQPFLKLYKLFAVALDGSLPEELPYGAAMSISFGPGGRVVIGRNQLDIARWKRYRGGTAGQLWVDAAGKGTFTRLLTIAGNFANPMWIGRRIYFVADHEGSGNIYSCTPAGADLRRHTDHDEYYIRNASTDGRTIVYHAGGDIYCFDVARGTERKVEIDLHSPRVQQRRRFVDAGRYLEDYAIHPAGHSLALTVRGKTFAMPFWEEAVSTVGGRDGVRHRLAQWLNDGKRLVLASDAGGEERLEVHWTDHHKQPERLARLDVGRAIELAVSPTQDVVAVVNQRLELLTVDLRTKRLRVLDRSAHGRITDAAWSPDGRWIAYSMPDSNTTSHIRICEAATGKSWRVTDTVLLDAHPSFDPEGRYLYLLSYRVFDPVYDNLHFDLNFPRGVKPFAIPLRKDLPSPFEPVARPLDGKGRKGMRELALQEQKKKAVKVAIDFEGITRRLVPFPVAEARYAAVHGLKGKVLLLSYPIAGSLSSVPGLPDAPADGKLESYDLEEQKLETLYESGIASFTVNAGGRVMVYRSGARLRAVAAGESPNGRAATNGSPSRQSGWLDLGRVKVSVLPTAEWRQMYTEAWRLQRDQFWTPDMSKVDWRRIYTRYERVLDRIATRSEFSDLIWEMQGELGTSHCYEMGGDYRPEPRYAQGFLGADLQYDRRTKAYRIHHLVAGDPWRPGHDAALSAPGLGVHAGDLVLAVDGQPVSATTPPQALLVNRAGEPVRLTVADRRGGRRRTITLRTLRDELPARYREWVEANRAHVARRSGGRVGYVHIPDMGPWGYAEFHRAYLREVSMHEALIVDVRFNGGGHVSQLLLEKLARKRRGYDQQRYGPPEPYPSYSVLGPIVAITNEYAGSDGDIFSHNFKLMNLGPLVGKRTWGGVIGIWPRHALVDGTITTQPEFSFWFMDVGWGVENYGTDPDIDVDIPPQDYARGRDPQLDTAIATVTRLLADNPPSLPSFERRPDLSQPRLPRREKK